MKKLLLTLIGVLFLSTAFAATDGQQRYQFPDGGKAPRDLLEGSTLVVSGTDTVYSPVFQLRQGWIRSLEFDLSTTGGADIEYGYVCSNTFDGEYVIPENVTALIDSVTDENTHIKAFTPVVANFYKLYAKGNAANVDATVNTANLKEAAQY